MVAIEDIRASNSALKSFPANLVAVFVGGTSGIGLYTARELVRNTTSPRLYLIGRNQTEATKIIEELKTINSSSEISFIQKDVSLLKNVDEACQDIKAKEKQVNLLFMTCGYVTFQGRTETSEGLDKKFALHYYTRMRFINQLQPLLDATAKANTLSRVVSVLDPQPGLKATPKWSDLSLKTSFSLKNCMVNATGMTNLAFYSLASKYPGTSYIHAYPHIVDTGAGRDAFGAFEPIAKPIMWLLRTAMQVKPVESGERHLYASTSPTFAPKAAGESAKGAAVGSDAVKGSGSYLLYWNNDILEDKPVAKTMREEGREKEVLQHTAEVFKKICDEGGKY